ncbi:hypothetical protein ALT_9151 [Aspergillus lentulus]|uniref:Uncharacterized protein n=1 Tax=Aspergillus lentulus TaxID=293939 RepID=A0AAN4PRP7_ASPLE|nr:hypothetical protein ALT_9151 [Aspergillus lentulus]
MTKDLLQTFDIHFDNELAHDYYGDGKKLAENLREIYHDRNLKFPDVFDSTLTTPPVHFISYDSHLLLEVLEKEKLIRFCSVEAPDDVKIEELQNVEVPPGLHVDIIDFQME